jgi:hypothetical protein
MRMDTVVLSFNAVHRALAEGFWPRQHQEVQVMKRGLGFVTKSLVAGFLIVVPIYLTVTIKEIS